eukprot:Clim_evm15s53 gene=Clim_evmTU15s53
MPRLRRQWHREPPEGFEIIEPTVRELQRRMAEAEREDTSTLKKNEITWSIYKVHYQTSRFIYDMYYKRKLITKEVYEWCLENDIGDRNLIAKWKKPGYDRLCCLKCMNPGQTNFATQCVCRVPKKDLADHQDVECTTCGCTGCTG